jgi:hypothetical protein
MENRPIDRQNPSLADEWPVSGDVPALCLRPHPVSRNIIRHARRILCWLLFSGAGSGCAEKHIYIECTFNKHKCQAPDVLFELIFFRNGIQREFKE